MSIFRILYCWNFDLIFVDLIFVDYLFNCLFNCFEQLSVTVFNYSMQYMLSSIKHSIIIIIIINQ